mgnify:CR=1 FL=1
MHDIDERLRELLFQISVFLQSVLPEISSVDGLYTQQTVDIDNYLLGGR